MLVILIISSLDAGFTGDEIDVSESGEAVLKFYSTLGKDTSYLNVNVQGELISLVKFYGAAFDLSAAWINKIIKPQDEFMVRHILNACLAILAIFFTGLLTRRVSGSERAALLAMWLMFLSPRFFGHAIFNTKDVPFAAASVIATYYMIRLFDEYPHFRLRSSIGLILSMGLAINSRIGGLLFIPYMVLFLSAKTAADNWMNQRPVWQIDLHRLKPFYHVALISIFGYLAGIIFWPFGLSGPVSNLLETIDFINKVPLRMPIIFGGSLINSYSVPWFYTIKYILITVPIIVLIGLLLSPLLLRTTMRKSHLLIIAFTIAFPLLYTMSNDVTLYNGWRHHLFIYPAMISLAAMTLNEIIHYRKTIATIVIVGLLLHPAYWIMKNNPYQVTYYNEVVGGLKGAYLRYEDDYYQLASRQAWEWLEQNVEIQDKQVVYTNNLKPVKELARHRTDITVIGGGFKGMAATDWDYAIMSTVMVPPLFLQNHYPPTGTIKVIEVDGVPISCVIKRENKLDYEAIQQLTRLGPDSAMTSLAAAYTYDPNNVGLWFHLGLAHYQRGEFSRAIEFLGPYELMYPNDVATKQLLGDCFIYLDNFEEAIKRYHTLVGYRPNSARFNYALGYCYSRAGLIEDAIHFLHRSIDLDPEQEDTYRVLIQVYRDMGEIQKAGDLMMELENGRD